MSNKTIAKFSGFVILMAAVSANLSGCAYVKSDPGKPGTFSTYGPPQITGNIKSKDITEASGIASSKCQNDVLWTHNDSGDEAFIFAVDQKGNNLGTWKVPNATNIDWEDIADVKEGSGACYIYIGEIGDNKSKRHEHALYRIMEPTVAATAAGTTRDDALASQNAQVIRFSYPDYDQDAETLLVHPKTGVIYVITKRISGPAGVYRIEPDFDRSETQKAAKIAEMSVPAIPNGFLTGGDISPDGRRVIICDYSQAYEYVLPDNAGSFEDIWQQAPEAVDLGRRSAGEAVGYSIDGASIIATSEGRHAPLIEVKRH